MPFLNLTPHPLSVYREGESEAIIYVTRNARSSRLSIQNGSEHALRAVDSLDNYEILHGYKAHLSL
jgi:hypothetical protein